MYVIINKQDWTVSIGFTLRCTNAVKFKLKTSFTIISASPCTA